MSTIQYNTYNTIQYNTIQYKTQNMYTQYYTCILSIHHGVAPAVPLSTKMLQYSVQVYSVNCAMRCMVPPPSAQPR